MLVTFKEFNYNPRAHQLEAVSSFVLRYKDQAQMKHSDKAIICGKCHLYSDKDVTDKYLKKKKKIKIVSLENICKRNLLLCGCRHKAFTQMQPGNVINSHTSRATIQRISSCSPKSNNSITPSLICLLDGRREQHP